MPEIVEIENGNVLLFARHNDLWRTDLTGEHIEQLTQGGQYDRENEDNSWWLKNPQLSPNGRWLTFANEDANLRLVDVTQANQLVVLNANSDFVAWTSDSRYFFYTEPQVLLLYDMQTQSGKRELRNKNDDTTGRTIAFSKT